jgi:hypothetical protein
VAEKNNAHIPDREEKIDLYPVDERPLRRVPSTVSGFGRRIYVQWLRREEDFIVPVTPVDNSRQYCPGRVGELVIGLPPCEGCQPAASFLQDDTRCDLRCVEPVVYRNIEDFANATRNWLHDPDRSTLGIGTRWSDSLLWEGVLGHCRRLIPLFASEKSNPHGCTLLLSAKASAVGWLEGLATENVVVSFQLMPEALSKRFEGMPDVGERIVPAVQDRLEAARRVASMGFEVRWRLHPVFPIPGWPDVYRDFLGRAVKNGHQPSFITLSNYCAPSPCPAPEPPRSARTPWVPERHFAGPSDDHFHFNIAEEHRAEVYRTLKGMIREAWKRHGPEPVVALCREPKTVRQAAGLDHGHCDCE